jgi:hypothetical protein
LEKTYVGNYIDIWESLIDNISLNSPKNLTETDAMIMNLISTHSPLLQLLQTIHTHTDLDPILANSFKLQALNTLFNQTRSQQKDSLYEIFTNLDELNQFLQEASTTKQKSTVTLPQEQLLQLRTTAEKYPEPIKNWLQMLVSSTQTYLQPEGKLNTNQKVAIKEAPLSVLEAQNLVVLPAPTEPSTPPMKPALKQKKLAQTTKPALPLRPTPLLPQAKEEQKKPEPPLTIEKQILTEKKATELPQETPTTEGRAEKQTPKPALQPGEYVRVLADNTHPMIFVQKD